MSIAVFGLGLFETAIIAVILGGFAFWLWMLVDCLMFEPSSAEKIVWILVIIFVGIVGAPIYFFARKLRRVTEQDAVPPGIR